MQRPQQPASHGVYGLALPPISHPLPFLNQGFFEGEIFDSTVQPLTGTWLGARQGSLNRINEEIRLQWPCAQPENKTSTSSCGYTGSSGGRWCGHLKLPKKGAG